jgi:DNA-binding transcriptional regulator GbsR (MarR family)
MTKTYSKQTLTLATSIGKFIEYWGFRRIHGEIWLLIYLSKEPVSTQELLKNLGVSKGLISTSVKTLMEYKLIYQIETENKKEKTFAPYKKVSPIISYVLQNREQVMLSTIVENFNQLKINSDPQLDPKRVKALGSYIKMGGTRLKGIIKFSKINLAEWRKIED